MRNYLQCAVLAGLVVGLASLPAFAAGGRNSSGNARTQSSSQAASPGNGSSQAKAAPVKPVKVNPKEEKAYKAFYEVPTNQPKDVISAGQNFLKMYPQSGYAETVYSRLAAAYEELGQADQMMDAGHKALALNPNDVDVLAMMAYAIPRRINPNNLDSGAKLTEAASDATKALELLSKMQKPANLTQEQFTTAINGEAAWAHSGLGLVDFRENDIPGMVTQLEQAVKLSPTPDPTDQFLLGIGYIQAGRPADAVDILQKCISEGGPMLAQCKNSLARAQKLAASQQKK